MKFDLFGIEIKIRKEYVVIGVFILLILLTLWGWYLKTYKVDVFSTDELAKPHKASETNPGEKSIGYQNETDTAKYEIKDRESAQNNNIISALQNGSDDLTIININTASVEDLTKLNGIGEAKAKAIVAYRESKGLFKSIDEIKNVKGIGEATFSKIKDYITIEETIKN